MFEIELETAVRLARDAAALIIDFYAKGVPAQQKIGVDNFSEPVTIADKAASRLIVDGLKKTFPHDFVLSEEEKDSPEARIEADRVWMIDPIDGTWGFIKKDGDFAVQIGLVENGEPKLGVVLLPVYKTLYAAVAGKGSFITVKDKQSRKLQVSNNTDFTKINLAVSRNHRSPKISRIMREFRLKQEIQRGSVGLKVGLIAERSADLYIHLSPRTKFWDTCGPQVILEEAGGRVTDLFGERMRYDFKDVQNHGGFVASNGTVHDQAIARLRPLLNEFGRVRISGAAG
ncbi:MAG: 3'(2'),5'-bisphosphate nucleotidase CysQ [Pyrinomonadaceae bacterium]